MKFIPALAVVFALLPSVSHAEDSLTGGETYAYHCTCVHSDSDCRDTFFNLTLNPDNTATLLAVDEDGKPVADARTGNYDPTYHPRVNKNAVRYIGWGSLLDPEYGSTVLIQKDLLSGGRELNNGRHGAGIKIEDTGEAFFSTSLFCQR